MATYLDIALPIIEKDPETGEFKATPYFEDYLYQIIDSIGGEGSDNVTASFDLDQLIPLTSKIGKIEKSVESLSQAINPTVKSKVSGIEKDVSDIGQMMAAFEGRLSTLSSLISTLSVFKVVTITADYTTMGNEIIICNNTSLITVTMNPSPSGGNRSYIKRANSAVNVTATKGIDGVTTKTIINKYDCPLLVYSSSVDEYSII